MTVKRILVAGLESVNGRQNCWMVEDRENPCHHQMQQPGRGHCTSSQRLRDFHRNVEHGGTAEVEAEVGAPVVHYEGELVAATDPESYSGRSRSSVSFGRGRP